MTVILLSILILIVVPVLLQDMPEWRDREGERQARERLGLPR